MLVPRTRPAPLAQFGPGAGQKLYLNFMTAKFLAARRPTRQVADIEVKGSVIAHSGEPSERPN